MRYLIDTDIIIDHLRGQEEASNFLKQIEYGLIEGFISVITEYELLAAPKLSSAQEAKINRLIQNVLPAVTVSSHIVRIAATFCRKYRDITMPDALIAATAHINKVVLLTRNSRHFRRIREITIKDLSAAPASSR